MVSISKLSAVCVVVAEVSLLSGMIACLLTGLGVNLPWWTIGVCFGVFALAAIAFLISTL